MDVIRLLREARTNLLDVISHVQCALDYARPPVSEDDAKAIVYHLEQALQLLRGK